MEEEEEVVVVLMRLDELQMESALSREVVD